MVYHACQQILGLTAQSKMTESAFSETVQLASDAIQIQERLILSLRQHLTVDGLRKEGHKIFKTG
jgi:hypothetical protein